MLHNYNTRQNPVSVNENVRGSPEISETENSESFSELIINLEKTLLIRFVHQR